jgi:RNA polymerase I-specific transcription initiation factor RRN3
MSSRYSPHHHRRRPATSGNAPCSRVATTTSISALSELTSFFPFDPYKLPRSSSYIEPIFREWASVAIEGDGDDEDDEDEDEDEMGGKGGLSLRDALDGVEVEADGLGASFGGMSISPGPVNARAPAYTTAVG